MNWKWDGFHELSYLLGFTECFCEMVEAGVKRLALSPVMTREHARRIAPLLPELERAYGVCFYEEREMLRSTLVPDESLLGGTVFLIYRDAAALAEYRELKRREGEYLARGAYGPAERARLSRGLCALLSYPEEAISKNLAKIDHAVSERTGCDVK